MAIFCRGTWSRNLIPIERQPPPEKFEIEVAEKGREFLTKNPRPKTWKNRSYWTKVLPDLWNAYQSVCAYSCHWIPLEGGATVDHFIPKDIAPEKAYDWDNYRLAMWKMNARKGRHTDIVDPFELTEATFTLSFPSMLVKPNPDLSEDRKRQVWDTIKRLDLNDDQILVNARLWWVLNYCDKHIDFQFLEKNAPFIAFEIERQNLYDKLPVMFRRRHI